MDRFACRDQGTATGVFLTHLVVWRTRPGRPAPGPEVPSDGARDIVAAAAGFFGFDVSHLMPARSGREAGNLIMGIGASPGRVTGTARVICGPEEFVLMKPGDILVAKITTPAWTPLFALASGVVTDVAAR